MAETGVDLQPRAREINSINFSKKNDIHIKAKYKTNEMIMKIDSAAQCNVISLETIKKLKTEQKIIIVKDYFYAYYFILLRPDRHFFCK